MAVTVEQIADLIKGTLDQFDKLKWTDLTSDLQEHVAMQQILTQRKIQFEGGDQITRFINLDHNHQARHTQLYEVDNTGSRDTMQSITVPWRHTETKAIWDIREPAINSGSAARLYDVVKLKRTNAMVSLAELMEECFWGVPVDDSKTPFGIFYWLTYNATEGFNGGNHTNFSAGPGGLSASTYSRWSNYTGQYTAVSRSGSGALIPMMKNAHRLCAFRPPVEGIPQYGSGWMPRYVTYCGSTTLNDFEAIGEGQNENLAAELFPYMDAMVARRTPIVFAPYLDNYSTSLPVVGVDWNQTAPFFLSEFYFKESGPDKAPNQHMAVQWFVDLSWNTVCTKRRSNYLFAKADPANGI